MPSMPLAYKAINKAQLSKKLAYLVPMLPRGNTYLPRSHNTICIPTEYGGNEKIKIMVFVITQRNMIVTALKPSHAGEGLKTSIVNTTLTKYFYIFKLH